MLEKILNFFKRQEYYLPYEEINQMDFDEVYARSIPCAEVNTPLYGYAALPKRGNFFRKEESLQTNS